MTKVIAIVNKTNMNKANRHIPLIFASVFFFNFAIYGQTIINKDLKSLFKHTHQKIDYSKPLKESTNEISMLVTASFLFYKKFISSQDKPACVFTPSCSVYAVQAFQKKGVFLGWLSAFDRLSRCHPMVKPNDYPYDKKTQRYYDPIQ
jgi:putative component of membrane protein insertase Oxa1/YidC/SpoIIIJ protein YidD